MAPIAVGPGTVEAAPFRLRRRYLVAAAATGAVLTAPAAGRSEVVVEDAPEVMWDIAGTDLSRIDLQALHAHVGELQRDVTLEAVGGRVGHVDDRVGAVAPAEVRSAVFVPEAREPQLLRTQADVEAVQDDVEAVEDVEIPPEQVGALPDGVVELARAGDLRIVTEGARVELVGFHESSNPGALDLDPTGDVTSVNPAFPGEAPGPDDPTVVLPTRHRASGPTTAVDVAMTPGEPVVAPVSGEVVEVADYALYGTTPDQLVRIRAADDPTVIVSVVHVDGASVAVGDEVEAGTTELAAEARQLSFESQIDRFTTAHRGAPAPHIHIELRRT